MAPKLFMYDRCPGARAVLMTAKTIGLQIENIQLNDTTREELAKINPQKTIPTIIDDDGFILWDSHAILTYLVAKYAKDDSLYPKDLKKRALIDQRLHFEGSVCFARIVAAVRPMMQKTKSAFTQEDYDSINELYGFVEAFLEGRQWVAGDHITIADFSLLSTITTISLMIQPDPKKFPRLTGWVKRSEQLPMYEPNKVGIKAFKEFLKTYGL